MAGTLSCPVLENERAILLVKGSSKPSVFNLGHFVFSGLWLHICHTGNERSESERESTVFHTVVGGLYICACTHTHTHTHNEM